MLKANNRNHDSFLKFYKPTPAFRHEESYSPRRRIEVEYIPDSGRPTFVYTSSIRGQRTKYEEVAKVSKETRLKNDELNLCKPANEWRLFVMKGNAVMESIHISSRCCYLLGRNGDKVDIFLTHPGVSKEHSMIQFRRVRFPSTNEVAIIPYIFDLGSTNKTYVNGHELLPLQEFELREKDTLRFGLCPKEYILVIVD
jgi:FHA domain